MNDEKKHKLIFLVYLKCRETRSKNGELCYMHFNMELPSLGWKHLVGATPLGEHRQWNISQSPFARKDVKESINSEVVLSLMILDIFVFKFWNHWAILHQTLLWFFKHHLLMTWLILYHWIQLWQAFKIIERTRISLCGGFT